METLASTKVIIVLWSKNSVKRTWVLKEARFAKRTNRLIPILIDNCVPPAQFNTIQAALMQGWNGANQHPELESLLAGISQLAPPSKIDTVRPGFITNFLGTDISLPAISGVADEFRYVHFSVIMNPARRLPWYVAYNMEPRQRAKRDDKWMPDPMLPAAFQPENSHFFHTGYNRGHIVSPSTVSWGTMREAQLANRQSFFWTNTSPQHPHMNQGWWFNVEEWERKMADTYKKAIGFGGPVFKDDDPVLSNTEQIIGRLILRQNFRRPRCYWKVLIIEKDKQLYSAAFLLDQDKLLENNTPINEPISSFRCGIKDIESLTKLDFGDIIRNTKSLTI